MHQITEKEIREINAEELNAVLEFATIMSEQNRLKKAEIEARKRVLLAREAKRWLYQELLSQ